MPEADTVIGWIAQMRDYNNVTDNWLLSEEVTAGEILYIALAHGFYASYENAMREKKQKQASK